MTSCREAFAAYIDATNTHDFDRVLQFIHPESTYWFGQRCHERIEEIRLAFEQAWARVADEIYEVRECRWLVETDGSAVVTYRYRWQGLVEGQVQAGGGLGTNFLKARAGRWQVVHGHLTPQVIVLGSVQRTGAGGAGPLPTPRADAEHRSAQVRTSEP